MVSVGMKLEKGEQGNSCEFKKLFDICCFFFSSLSKIVQKMWHFFPSDSNLYKAAALGPAHSRPTAGRRWRNECEVV